MLEPRARGNSARQELCSYFALQTGSPTPQLAHGALLVRSFLDDTPRSQSGKNRRNHGVR